MTFITSAFVIGVKGLIEGIAGAPGPAFKAVPVQGGNWQVKIYIEHVPENNYVLRVLTISEQYPPPP